MSCLEQRSYGRRGALRPPCGDALLELGRHGAAVGIGHPCSNVAAWPAARGARRSSPWRRGSRRPPPLECALRYCPGGVGRPMSSLGSRSRRPFFAKVARKRSPKSEPEGGVGVGSGWDPGRPRHAPCTVSARRSQARPHTGAPARDRTRPGAATTRPGAATCAAGAATYERDAAGAAAQERNAAGGAQLLADNVCRALAAVRGPVPPPLWLPVTLAGGSRARHARVVGWPLAARCPCRHASSVLVHTSTHARDPAATSPGLPRLDIGL